MKGEIKRLENCGLDTPSKGTPESAGYDLRSNNALFILEPKDRALIDTGFAWKIPEGYVGIIKPRSGLANKYGIDILGGVIDSDYRGEVKAILINHGVEQVPIDWSDRICQMIIIKIGDEDGLTEVDEFDSTERGEGGFGHTGKN